MTILNTTFAIDPAVSAEALEWIRQYFRHSSHVGERAPMLARVLAAEPEPGQCETYALHLPFADTAQAQAWRDSHGAALLRSMARRWGQRAVCFQTLLDVID